MPLSEKENLAPTKPIPQVKASIKGMYSTFHFKVIRKLRLKKNPALRDYVQAPCKAEMTPSALILSPASMCLFCEFTSNVPNCIGLSKPHRGSSAGRRTGRKLRCNLLFRKCKVQIRKLQASPLWFGF